MQISSSWLELARLNVPVTVAADAMKCSKGTAAKRLDQAHGILGSQATPNQAAAVGVLLASGAADQEIKRRRWQDVLLGYKRAA